MARWRLIVPVDDSPHAAHALDVALDMARSLGAELAILHVVDLRLAIIPDAGIASEEILAGLRDAGKAVLDSCKSRVPAGISVTYFTREGVIVDEIVDIAKQWGASGVGSMCMIVIGTHGRSGLSRLLLGSTAEAVLRHSPVPVLAVPTRPHTARA